ncbi:MAG: alpha/beta fold hydrolase [Bacteroidales bacterium]|nr:alpha/beta fold hydrolase [Bacteroidales bacterium]
MELFYRKLGKGKPLVVLHGLYGSSDNWYTLGKQLAQEREVYLVDLRNHGRSPHHPEHSYGAMRDDLHEFLVQHSLFKPVLMGHSMGGRVAMFFASMHPKLIEKLIVTDISPCSYNTEDHLSEIQQHKTIIQALRSIDISHLSARSDADIQLAKTIKSSVIRQFLLKNLKAEGHKNFRWCLNLPALEKNLQEILLGIDIIGRPSESQMDFPALFIRGQLSGYIKEKDMDCIHHFFKNATIITISNASHWVHAEEPGRFMVAVKEFLEK